MAVDLSNSWDTTSPTFIGVNSTQTPSRQPNVWYNENANRVYWTGGESYEKEGNSVDAFAPITLSEFTAGVENFTTSIQGIGLGDPVTSNLGGTSSTFSPRRAHYSLGGYLGFVDNTGFYDQLAVDNFLAYTYSNSSWTNITTPQPLNTYNLYGEAQFVPIYGREGVVLFFGGKDPSTRGVNGVDAIQDFTNIFIYNIFTNSFHSQRTSGDAPLPRWSFCSAGAAAADNSSYEMYSLQLITF